MRILVSTVAAALALFWATGASAGVQRLLRPMQHMQRVMGMRVALHAPAYPWYRQVWEGYQHPPHKAAWLCIHRYEGSWKDRWDPYWGGLQFDRQFMDTYGSYLVRLKGYSGWSVLEQMWTAEKAFRSGRGFGPWPNTARYCGLI